MSTNKQFREKQNRISIVGTESNTGGPASAINLHTERSGIINTSSGNHHALNSSVIRVERGLNDQDIMGDDNQSDAMRSKDKEMLCISAPNASPQQMRNYIIEKKNFSHNANSQLSCQCPVCVGQNRMSIPYLQKVEQDRKIKKDRVYSGTPLSFKQLIQCLLPTGPIQGCEILMPDTVFFQQGKPKFIVRMDSTKQRFLNVVKHPGKLQLREIKKQFQRIVWNRKKVGITQGNTLKSSQAAITLQNTNLQSNRKQASNASKIEKQLQRGNDYGFVQNASQCLGKQTAILRCENQSGEEVSVLLQKGFSQFMMRRQSDPKWLDVRSIQTCIKSHKGIGSPIYINFFAPIDINNKDAEINYDLRKFPSDQTLLMRKDQRDYCLKQCFKICFFVSKAHGYQILRMKALFLLDDNGVIWFSDCSRIEVRSRKKRDLENEFIYKKVSLLNQENKKKLMEELNEHQEQSKAQNNENIKKIYDVMSNHYQNIKGTLGITNQQNENQQDSISNEAFERLRPGTGKKFSQFITSEYDFENMNPTNRRAIAKYNSHTVVGSTFSTNRQITSTGFQKQLGHRGKSNT